MFAVAMATYSNGCILATQTTSPPISFTYQLLPSIQISCAELCCSNLFDQSLLFNATSNVTAADTPIKVTVAYSCFRFHYKNS